MRVDRPVLARRALGGCLLAASLLAAWTATAHAGDPDPRSRYPAHWWQEVDESEVAWWEILPQAAGPGEVILSKRNELGLLSNFAPTPFTFRGREYASLEGFWQAMKYPEGDDDPRLAASSWRLTRRQVSAMVGFEAKAAGDEADRIANSLGIDWVSFEGERIPYRTTGRDRHYQLIEAATRAKLAQNDAVREVLSATGDLTLRPDHVTEPDAPPAWRYYDICMKLRTELAGGAR